MWPWRSSIYGIVGRPENGMSSGMRLAINRSYYSCIRSIEGLLRYIAHQTCYSYIWLHTAVLRWPSSFRARRDWNDQIQCYAHISQIDRWAVLSCLASRVKEVQFSVRIRPLPDTPLSCANPPAARPVMVYTLDVALRSFTGLQHRKFECNL
jgi:hypothetical protein